MSDGETPCDDTHADDEDARLEELRGLLVRPEQVKLEELDRRIPTSETLAEQVSKVLAHAVAMRGSPDDRLALVLRPIVEDSIKSSVRSNPQFFADILYPVMGPAIRKSINEALRAMMEAFNSSLEMTFSRRSLEWRWEAMRTGRPFSEVVLLHTLVYRVEQVFLLHRESGLLLRHVCARGVVAQDAEVVSGMLTAIRDFVHDSFGGGEDTLESFRVGELGVWVEQAPHSALAAVVRGNPPAELSTLLRTQLELIELQFGVPLEEYRGDSSPFERADELLKPCLVLSQSGLAVKRDSRPLRRESGPTEARRTSLFDRLLPILAVLGIIAIVVFTIVTLRSL